MRWYVLKYILHFTLLIKRGLSAVFVRTLFGRTLMWMFIDKWFKGFFQVFNYVIIIFQMHITELINIELQIFVTILSVYIN